MSILLIFEEIIKYVLNNNMLFNISSNPIIFAKISASLSIVIQRTLKSIFIISSTIYPTMKAEKR